jgi:hypothetical protein
MQVGGEKVHVTFQRSIFSIGLMLAASSVARADMRVAVPVDAQPAATLAAKHSTVDDLSAALAASAVNRSSLATTELTSTFSRDGAQPSTTHTLNLPGTPGSATLFLSAILSVGALRVMRSAKDLHISALPEWYHTGGPTQIGHAVPFDLDFGACVPCSFEQPVEPRPFFSPVDESPQHCLAQCVRAITAPRGPPLLA